jgi:hypothetical protein
MSLSSRVLGTPITKQITHRAHAPLLQVGADRLSRADLSHVDFYSPIAAANLSRILQEFPVKNLKDLYEKVPPAQLLVPGIGAWAIAALGAAFELKRIGGDLPLESWMKKHAERDDKHPITTVATIKTHLKASPDTKRRKRQKSIAANGSNGKS